MTLYESLDLFVHGTNRSLSVTKAVYQVVKGKHSWPLVVCLMLRSSHPMTSKMFMSFTSKELQIIFHINTNPFDDHINLSFPPSLHIHHQPHPGTTLVSIVPSQSKGYTSCSHFRDIFWAICPVGKANRL